MPKIRINNIEFDLDKSPYKQGSINDENYIEALNKIDEFRESPEYKGQSAEEILDILIRKEKREEKIADMATFEMNERFSRQPYNLAGKFSDVKSKLHEEYYNRYGSIYDTIVDDIRRLWGENIQGLNEEVIQDYYIKGIYNDFSDEGKIIDFSKIYERVKQTVNHLTREERDNDNRSDYYKMLSKWSRQAGDVLRFQEIIGPLKTTKDDYVAKKMQAFEVDYLTDPQYKAVEDELKQNKATYFQEMKEELSKTYKTPLQSAKQLLSERKAQCVNLLKARDDLAKDYYKTGILSRIARWIPFVPSKAGQIQSEINKLDKAIKDAGYEKKEIENIKKEMKSENPVVENNNLENKVEVKSETKVLETTEELVNAIKDATVQEVSNNKSKAVKQEDFDKTKVVEGDKKL